MSTMNRVKSSPENCGSRINRDQDEELSTTEAKELQRQIIRKILAAQATLELLLRLRIGIYSCRYLITLTDQIPIIEKIAIHPIFGVLILLLFEI